VCETIVLHKKRGNVGNVHNWDSWPLDLERYHG